MGSVCCVAARNKNVSNGRNSEGSFHHAYAHRNAIYSPSWSFRWDGRTHVGNSIADSNVQMHCDISLRNSSNISGEMKGRVPTEPLLSAGSPIESFQTPTWPKSPVFSDATEDFVNGVSDVNLSPSASNKVFAEAFTKPPAVGGKREPCAGSFVTHGSPLSKSNNDASSSQNHLPPPNSTPSRQTRRSPGHPLSRQISDSRMMALKSLGSPASEGRQSFVLSVCSNDLTMGSQGGSSDGWSMRTFSELVASSQRERWSFDSENFGCNLGKITRSNSMQFSPPSMTAQTCGLCLKHMDLPYSIVAVLVCGHVYHADCLENLTSETDKFDPRCPVCTSNQKSALKIFGKALKVDMDLRSRTKISRIGVADGDLGRNYSGPIKSSKREGKDSKMTTASSSKSHFGKPFLRRHFSLGSRPSHSLTEPDSARRKGFWARYFRE